MTVSFTAQGNGIYVNIDQLGNITTSTDNIVWTQPIAPFRANDAHWTFGGIVFANNYFVAYGNAIIIISTGLPGSMWESSLTVGGNWQTCLFNGTNWVLTDNLNRTATSRTDYPAIWTITQG